MTVEVRAVRTAREKVRYADDTDPAAAIAAAEDALGAAEGDPASGNIAALRASLLALAAILAAGSVEDAVAAAEDALGAPSGDALAATAATISDATGGWADMPGDTFMEFVPPLSFYTAIDPVITSLPNNEGPASIIQDWNTWARDPDDRIIIIPAQGGHGNWGGNETYFYHLDSGTWEMAIAPSAYPANTAQGASGDLHEGDDVEDTFPFIYEFSAFYELNVSINFGAGFVSQIRGVDYEVTAPGVGGTVTLNAPLPTGATMNIRVGYPQPLSGPPSCHGFDGVWFQPNTKTVMLIPSADFTLGGGPRGRQIWELNPSKVETRNGLAPLAWRRNADHTMTYADGHASVQPLPSDHVYVLVGGSAFDYDPVDEIQTGLGSLGDFGAATTAYDPMRNCLWHVFGESIGGRLARSDVDGVPVVVADLPYWRGGIDVDADGRVAFWPGGKTVYEWDVEDEEWIPHVFETGPADPATTTGGKIYGKWSFVASHGVFIGMDSAFAPIHVFKLPPVA